LKKKAPALAPTDNVGKSMYGFAKNDQNIIAKKDITTPDGVWTWLLPDCDGAGGKELDAETNWAMASSSRACNALAGGKGRTATGAHTTGS
jgi:hypothetical protein